MLLTSLILLLEETDITIYYHGKEGKLTYDNGDIVAYKLDECPELLNGKFWAKKRL